MKKQTMETEAAGLPVALTVSDTLNNQIKALCAQKFEPIATAEDANTIAAHRKEAKDLIGKIADARLAVTRQLDTAKKTIMAEERRIVAPLEALVSGDNNLLDTWDEKNKRKQEEAQRRAEEKARRDAEAERDRKALEAIEKGREDVAERIFEVAANTPLAVPEVKPVVEKTAGTHTMTTWSFEITDPNLIPREYCTPNQVALNAVAKALKGNCNIPGGRAVPKVTRV